MSEELTLALVASLVPIFAAISSLFTFLVTTRVRQRKEWREGGEKAYEKAIEILKGRFERADDAAERAEIEQQLRGVEDDYLPYLQKKATDVSRDVVDKLAPAGAIAPDMPELSPSDREALERAAATIADLDPPKTAEDHFLQGNAFYAAREYDKSLSEFDAALELRPDHPDTLNNRGNALDRLKRYGEALVDFNRALELGPDNPITITNRGSTLDNLQRYDEALADYNRSLELRPNHPGTLNNRGVTLQSLQRYDEALADFQRALELDPDSVIPVYNQASVYSLMGRLEESLEQLKEAISRDPTYRALARDDEEFANLRSDPKLGPEFERLVAEPQE